MIVKVYCLELQMLERLAFGTCGRVEVGQLLEFVLCRS
jgi:hypothetical protein